MPRERTAAVGQCHIGRRFTLMSAMQETLRFNWQFGLVSHADRGRSVVQRWNASRMDVAVAAAPTVAGRPSSSSVVRSSE
jgi:hypothetical protein